MTALTAHRWRTISSSADSLVLRCEVCRATTNNAFLADIHRETCPGKPTETVETLAEKLRAIEYQEPILPRRCAVQDCDGFTQDPERVTCDRCAEEIAADAWKPSRVPAWCWWLLAVVAAIAGVALWAWLVVTAWRSL